MNRFTKFAWATLAVAVLDILWGAFVRASGSGAGCGNHWPACNGQIIPTPQNIATVIEFVHRTLSGLAMICVLVLLIWGWRRYPRGNPIRLGVTGSAAFILLEAALGAGLVLFNLVDQNSSAARAVVVALHLINTFILLAFLALTAWWAAGGKAVTTKNKGNLPLLFAIGLAGVALLGMSGAITALGDTLFPVQTLAQGMAQDADTSANFLVRLRVIHPIIAGLIGVYTLIFVRLIYRRNGSPTAQRLSLVLAGLVLAQIMAGFLNLILLAPIWMQIVHLFLADSVWIGYVLLAAATLDVEIPASTTVRNVAPLGSFG